ncbi:MAG TPA: TM0106 family RecB-like putative nuclease [Candidatus Acidoferrales bacterium]|nr:TM0106 family RecB-like putative nuclease [Candidatus Acidoferrales bacterium]
MQRLGERLIFSASDLNDFLECPHLTALQRRVALGELERPEPEESAKLLARKGAEHEARYLARLRASHGENLVAFSDDGHRSEGSWKSAERATFEAMQSGASIIYQATFFDGRFLGKADFLRRIERPSADWPWSYEVIDTKLALVPKPYYLIQLSNYTEHVARLQGSVPARMHVVLGSGQERSFRTDDFAAYYRHVKERFVQCMDAPPANTYPFETEHCSVCRWLVRCERQRDRDDHLSVVANVRRDQIAKLEAAGIPTLTALASAPDEARPFGMMESTFEKLRGQARLQHHARSTGEMIYELLDHDSGAGFELLPRPDPGDVFFDIEGDPLYAPERGLEYLFGVYLPLEGEYRAWWARSDRDERAAFEALMDFLTERRAAFPEMHVYHYADYETTALRRLMGFYATRERALDDLLRGETFVDLYTVVRQALRISQPSYSIKRLETFYGLSRSTGVKRGDDSIVMFESWLASGDETILHDIERYNEDDCRSTWMLREWLLERRRERESAIGRCLAWSQPRAAEAPDDGDRSELAARLLDGLPAPRSLREIRQAADSIRGRWLLGHLLDYHAREAKPAYWRLYDRYKNVDRLLEFDHEAIGELKLRGDIPPERDKHSFVYTYAFPVQQHNLGNDQPFCPDAKCGAGKIVAVDEQNQLLRIKLSKAIVPERLRALIPPGPMATGLQRNAIARIAEAYLDGTLPERHPATLSLLLGRRPRFSTERDRVQPATVDARSVSELVASLEGSHLVVQGPPGSGKSTIGASFIVDLLAAGKRVGVLANGHKAIHNLLRKVEETAVLRGTSFRGVQKFTKENEGSRYESPLGVPMVRPVADAKEILEAPHELAAGTPWLFSRDDLTGRYDVLVVDEAGQISLADAVACSPCARNIVLLGDPLQLAQVAEGSHPLGTDLSVLEHLLAGDETVDPKRGVFLDVSYRMHPAICEFVSRIVYDGRLHAAPRCGANRVEDSGLSGSGLRYLPVVHDHNYRSSVEEADAIAEAIAGLLRGTVVVGDAAPRPIGAGDVLVVSPYNAQRKCLRQRLVDAGIEGVAVGTVDKFQGQEAPVVFYSMATSSGAYLPRDLEFLFEKNRLNVAISRAQCLTVLVCSPLLLELRCKTPEQMSLVNLLCAYVESAAPVQRAGAIQI